jgi:hypothetical protein
MLPTFNSRTDLRLDNVMFDEATVKKISKQGKGIKISRIRFNTPQINQRNGS